MDNSIKDISIKDIGIMQDKIIEDFDLFDDWADKYRYLISLGNDLPEYPKDKMTEQYFVHGCQSQVWFYASLNSNGNMSLFATSDAAIVKGLIGLLLSIFDQQQPQDVLAADLSFIKKIGFDKHLSLTRSNGLSQMIRAMKQAAAKFMV